jgi:prophage regulatory protein
MRILTHDRLKPEKGIPYSKTQLWRLERLGLFPKRVRLGAKFYGYVEDEIDQYLAGRISARDAAA